MSDEPENFTLALLRKIDGEGGRPSRSFRHRDDGDEERRR